MSNYDVQQLVREIESSMRWMNGRLSNIKADFEKNSLEASFMNESPDIQLETQQIINKIERLRLKIRAEKQGNVFLNKKVAEMEISLQLEEFLLDNSIMTGRSLAAYTRKQLWGLCGYNAEIEKEIANLLTKYNLKSE